MRLARVLLSAILLSCASVHVYEGTAGDIAMPSMDIPNRDMPKPLIPKLNMDMPEPRPTVEPTSKLIPALNQTGKISSNRNHATLIENNILQMLYNFDFYDNADSILSTIAILISIIGLLYTMKSDRGPTILTARIKHTEGIKNFIEEWRGNIPVIKAPIHEFNREDSVSRITEFLGENWEYDDLVKHHVPRDLKSFSKEWDTYINNVNNYQDKCNNLFDKIRDDINKNIVLNYDPNVTKDNIFTKYFIELIYTQHINWINSGKLFYSRENLCAIEGNNLYHHLHGYLLARGNNLVLAKELFEKMMLNEDYLMKYKISIEEIITIHKDIEQNEIQIKYILDLLMGQPLLPGTKCKFLRSAFGWRP